MISGNALWIVGAMLTQGVIAFVLLAIVAVIRMQLVSAKQVRMREMAVSRDVWPEHEKRVSNAFDNQFQLPVLFFVACGISLTLGAMWIEAVLAWAFVLARVVHAAIHAGRNHVPTRFFVFLAGFAVLAVFWLELIARLAFMGIWNNI
jgi:hypothetical protein